MDLALIDRDDVGSGAHPCATHVPWILRSRTVVDTQVQLPQPRLGRGQKISRHVFSLTVGERNGEPALRVHSAEAGSIARCHSKWLTSTGGAPAGPVLVPRTSVTYGEERRLQLGLSSCPFRTQRG